MEHSDKWGRHNIVRELVAVEWSSELFWCRWRVRGSALVGFLLTTWHYSALLLLLWTNRPTSLLSVFTAHFWIYDIFTVLFCKWGDIL